MSHSMTTTTGKTKIKIVLLGNQNVGKSCIIEKYVKNQFDQSTNPTVGIDFLVKNVTHNNKNYRLQLWDTAGQQRFRSLIPNYLKDAKCAVIVIDVTNKISLNNAESWLKLYNDNRTIQGFTFLIGNKIDLQYRQVSQEEAQRKGVELGLPYFEVSAKTGQNLDQLFEKLIEVTQQKSLTGISFDLSKKQSEVIKQQQNNKQEDTEIKEENLKKRGDESKQKQKSCQQKKEGSQKTEVVTTETGKVVLKNEKIEKKNTGNNGCC